MSEFNLFEAAGLTNQEIRHSRFLSFLLDPKGAHGLGDLFVTRVLQAAVSGRPPDEVGVTALDLELMDLSDFEISCEVHRIDILLLSPANRFAVIVENKVGTGEHSNQLPRYLATVEGMRPGWRTLPLLLSPRGIEPSDPRYFPVSYESVAEILASIAGSRRTSLSPDVALAMAHYERLLRRHVVSDAKLKDLCQQIIAKHRKAIDLLIEHMEDPRTPVRLFVDNMLSDAGWERGSGSYRFPADWARVVPPGDDGNPIVSFWIDDTQRTLSLIMEIIPGDQEIRRRLFEAANANPNLFNRTAKTLGKMYCRIIRYRLADSPSPHDGDTEAWESEVRQRFDHFCLTVLPRAGELLRAACQ